MKTPRFKKTTGGQRERASISQQGKEDKYILSYLCKKKNPQTNNISRGQKLMRNLLCQRYQ